MIKVHYDATTGAILGYYPNAIAYPGGVPCPNIEIGRAAYIDCLNNPNRRQVDVTALKIVEFIPVLTLAETRMDKIAERKAARTAAEAATPFVYDGSSFDYDALSRERIDAAISGAIIAALSGADTSTVVDEWTLHDNTKRSMTIADWLAFRTAEKARRVACHVQYNELKKATIDADAPEVLSR